MLELKDRIALAEVDDILTYTELELVNRIPKSMRDFISQNKQKEYQSNICVERPICEQKLLKETEAILSLIFRDYWATDEEKKQLAEKDKLELENFKKNTQIVFPVSHKSLKQDDTCLALQINQPWYEKIYAKIRKVLEIFHIKNK